jgi:hypothetical protein
MINSPEEYVYDKFSRGICPNCHTNNYEQLSADSGVGNLER